MLACIMLYWSNNVVFVEIVVAGVVETVFVGVKIVVKVSVVVIKIIVVIEIIVYAVIIEIVVVVAVLAIFAYFGSFVHQILDHLGRNVRNR